MRVLLCALGFVTVMVGATAHADEQLAVALERAGYFTGLDPQQSAALRAEIVTNGYAGALQHARRVTLANTQILAAGGVGHWVREDLRPLLASRGVTFRPAEDHLAVDGSGYSVLIGSDEFPMWGAGEANTERASTIAAFAMVNALLESISAPERLYLIGEGVTARAWLLTPAQAEIVRAVAPPEAWPYLPGVETVMATTPAAPIAAALPMDTSAPAALTAISAAPTAPLVTPLSQTQAAPQPIDALSQEAAPTELAPIDALRAPPAPSILQSPSPLADPMTQPY